jgi:hypothetical protein
MTLPAGSHLGPYEILSAIGAGGMGEVYRVARAPFGVCVLRAHRLTARPDAGSTARLTPHCALAPAARGSSLGYFGRLLAPRPED